MLVATGIAFASPQPQSMFTVDATVVPGCLIEDGSDKANWGTLDFGVHQALANRQAVAVLKTTSSLRIQCTRGLSMQMRINSGRHASGSQRLLKLANSAHTVPYQLYSDAGHTKPLLSGQVTALSAPATGDPLPLSIHAVANLHSSLPAGIYTDQLTIQLSW